MLKIILVHDVFDNLVFRFIDHKRFAAACRLVSKTWRCLVAVLQSLFLHAAQNLARETDRIVFVHPFDNTLDQRTERTVDQRLGDADYINIILFEERLVDNGFLLVARETAVFPDQDHVDRVGVLLRKGDHLLKLRPPVRMPARDGFLEDELFCDDNPVLLRVVQEKTLLRIRREFCLIRGADADVESTIFKC